MGKSPAEVEAMARAGAATATVLRDLEPLIKPGVQRRELEEACRDSISRWGLRSSFLNYHGYPYTLIADVNDIVMHGVDDFTLSDGDIVGVEVGAIRDGWHSLKGRTYAVGTVDAAALRLIAGVNDALVAGAAQCRSGNRLGAISHAIQQRIEDAGCSAVREYGGCGIGTAHHEAPFVPNFGAPGKGGKLKVGDVFAVHPIANLGRPETVIGEWAVRSADGSLSACAVDVVAITRDGPRVLTADGKRDFPPLATATAPAVAVAVAVAVAEAAADDRADDRCPRCGESNEPELVVCRLCHRNLR